MSTTRDTAFGCVLWTGKTDKSGYGYHGRSRAHIVAWESVNGPRPKDDKGVTLELDHGCRRPSCVAVHHIQPVTARENQLRKSWAYRAAMKRCQFGHDLTQGNRIVTPEMGICCRACNQAALRGDRSARGASHGAR